MRRLALITLVGIFGAFLVGCSGRDESHDVGPPPDAPKLKVPDFAKKKPGQP